MSVLLEALLVQFLLLSCYVAPPFLAFRLWRARGLTPWLMGIAGAMCLQSALGWMWNQFAPGPLWMQPFAYALVWLGVAGVVRAPPGDDAADAPDRWLWMLLALAFALRMVDPLRTAALGQSDAYSHWQFIFDVVEKGRVRNAVYPPGYHWVLGLPTMLSGLDPYLMARFGGAFAGTLLVAALYALAERMAGRTAARWAAWFAGLCPAAWWLIKTGVGVFPNQFGLLLLACAWLAYLRWLSAPSRRALTPLVIVVAGMATATPMFLLDLALVLGLHQALVLLRASSAERRRAALLVGLGVVSAIPLVFLLMRAGPDSLRHTVVALTGALPPHTGDAAFTVPELLGVLTRDFFSIKRSGLGSPLFSAAAAVLAALFTAGLAASLRRRRTDVALLSLWGLLAALQTGWGVLQFEHYQRAGWQLMMAVALLVGWIAHRLPVARGLTLAGLAALVTVGSFVMYPRHQLLHSAAEPELVTFLRAVAREQRILHDKTPARVIATPRLPDGMTLHVRRGLTILARRYTGFTRGQGDPVYAALGHRDGTEIRPLGAGAPLELKPRRQYLLIRDEAPPPPAGLSARMNAALAAMAAPRPERIAAAHRELDGILAGVDPAQWTVHRHALAPALEVYLLLPREP